MFWGNWWWTRPKARVSDWLIQWVLQKGRRCRVCPCPHQRDRDISRPACLNDWTIKPSEEIKPCLSVCFLLGSFHQHYGVGLRNHVYQKGNFFFFLFHLLFCGTLWWKRHECFSGKKYFYRLGLVKAPYMVVACVPLALWLDPHIQHFMLYCYVMIQRGIKPLECCNSFVHECILFLVQPTLWNLETISRMHTY